MKRKHFKKNEKILISSSLKLSFLLMDILTQGKYNFFLEICLSQSITNFFLVSFLNQWMFSSICFCLMVSLIYLRFKDISGLWHCILHLTIGENIQERYLNKSENHFKENRHMEVYENYMHISMDKCLNELEQKEIIKMKLINQFSLSFHISQNYIINHNINHDINDIR